MMWAFLVPQGQPISPLEMSLISLNCAWQKLLKTGLLALRQNHGLDPSRFDLPGLDTVLRLPNPCLVHALGELPDPSKIRGFLMTKNLLVSGRGLARYQLQLFLWDPSLPCRSHVG